MLNRCCMYCCLHDYIDKIPKYRCAFYLRDTVNNSDSCKSDERKRGQMEAIQWMIDNPNATPEQAMHEFGIWG